ncbi:MAG: efflux RND transporter periplasmic adaptor subunit [Anaerolineae bacterium]
MTTTLPRRRGLSKRWLFAGVLLVVATIAVALVIAAPRPQPLAASGSLVTVSRGNITSRISGTGVVAAANTLGLSFQAAGNVTEVLVEPGDVVEAGQPLARLDDRALQIQLVNAQASLSSAQARLTQAREGNARPEDIAASQAALAQAEASYEKATAAAGAGDVAAAQAQVASAQSSYAAALASAGTTNSQLEASRASLQKAEIALQQAQVDYADAMAKDTTDTTAAAAYQRAQIDYQQAKANYDSLASTADSSANSQVQSALAQLEQAKASLANLTDSTTAADLTSAQASVDQARANLAKLTAPATETDLAIQGAAVTQAEQSVKQAELSLEAATLVAPFSGVVTAVNVVVGSQVGAAATPAVSLMDTTTMHVDLRLNENDVARVSVGQPVSLTVDSLDGWMAEGRVDYIAPAAETINGVVTYATRVTFTSDDPSLKVGMTANLDIITASSEATLIVPTTALLPKGAGHVVQVPSEDGTGVTEVDVQTGLSDNTNTEILSGLQEGDVIVAIPANQTRQFSGPFGGMGGG